MQRYMLSWLKQKYLALELKAFRAQVEHHCLVWEPGAWRPPAKTGSTVVALPADPSVKAKGGDALVLMLVAAAGRSELVLGRDATSDLLIDDGTVSAKHVQLLMSAGGWSARGLGATNGTWVNQKPLEPKSEVALQSDDQLRLGQVCLTFFDPKGLYFRLKAGA